MPRGTFLIPGIIKVGAGGRQLLRMHWTNKPSPRPGCPKLSFNLVLDKYQWVSGHGFLHRRYRQRAGSPAAKRETMHASLQSSVLLILVILG